VKKTFIFFIFFSITLFAQQNGSEAFKENQPKPKNPTIIPKYPSYNIITGFLLQKEANGGDPFAMHELGLRYLIGNGFAADTTKAVYWIKKAVDAKLTSAIFNYAIMFNNGIGVEWNPFKAFKFFKEAAEAGMPEGEYAYALMVTDNLIVNRNYSETYKYLKKSIAGGFEPAKEVFKEMKEKGLFRGFDENESTSNQQEMNYAGTALLSSDFQLDFFQFEEDSLTDEQEKAMVEEFLNKDKNELKKILGVNQLTDKDTITDTTAAAILNIAKNAGSPEALLIEGKSSSIGLGKEQDFVKASANFLRAYRLGSRKAVLDLLKIIKNNNYFEILKEEVDIENPEAMFVWAGLTGLEIDFQITQEQAINLLKKAAELNYVPALIELGLIYHSGEIVEKDENTAFKYWEKASELGSTEAKVRLAFSSILQADQSEDQSKNMNILTDALNEGSVLASSALGYCYENGIYVKQDKAMASRFYRSSAQRGSMVAYNSLKKMYDEIRPDDEIFVIYEE